MSPASVTASTSFGAGREYAAVQRTATLDRRSLLSSFAEQRAELLEGLWICRLDLGCMLRTERDDPLLHQHVHGALRLRAV